MFVMTFSSGEWTCPYIRSRPHHPIPHIPPPYIFLSTIVIFRHLRDTGAILAWRMAVGIGPAGRFVGGRVGLCSMRLALGD